MANTAFGISTAIIAIPTGVKIFNWMGTMYGGDIQFATPMLYAVGAVTMFVIGGLSGVTHAIVPSDYQQTDTYYIVAHFHYVIFGGAVFGIFAGLYYWWPKVFGRTLERGSGQGAVLDLADRVQPAFGPMHILGLQGMIRREYTYPESLGLTFWNQMSTVGAFLIAVSVLMFIVNVVRTQPKPRGRGRRGPVGRAHPRVDRPRARRRCTTSTRSRPCTRSTSSGTASTSRTSGRARSYRRRRGASDAAPTTSTRAGHGSIHLPSPSYWPLVSRPRSADHGLRRAVFLVADRRSVRWSCWSASTGWALEPSVAED